MAQRTSGESLLSIAVPVYNESGIVEAFVEELLETLDGLDWGGDHELVFCNDGSTDGSGDILNALAAQHTGRIRVVHLARNFGQGAALMACLDHVRGDPVILMDGDMQDSPEAFGLFLEQWRAGYNVVYAVRSSREENARMRALVWLFYRGLRWLANIDIPLDAGNFGLIDGAAVEALRRFPERDVYFPGLRAWTGFRQSGVPIARRARYDRKTRVGWRGLISLAGNAVFAFSYVPLFAFRLGSFLAMLLAAGLLTHASFVYIFRGGEFTSAHVILVALSLFTGVNLLGITVLGEYIARVYNEVRGRPRYVVSRLVEDGPEKDG